MLNILNLNLQFFSEADDTGGSNPDNEEEIKTDETAEEENEQEEKTFTQDQVDQIVKDRIARAEKDKAEAVKEAEKLAKMSADQKREYELDKLKRENEELKASQNRFELGKTATAILAESGIVADDEILEIVVKEDAEKTNNAVKAFIALVDKVSDERMREKLKGNAPKKQQAKASTLTKQEILEIRDSFERKQRIAENPHLFKK